jgi:hypothetical protein
MVYGMVQRHSAEIEIDSAPNKGTTLRLTFPAAANEATLRDQQVKQALPIQPLRILIVDDDPLIIESLRNTLQKDGHRVTGHRRQPFVPKSDGSGERPPGTVSFTSRSRVRPNSWRALGRSGTAERRRPTAVRGPFRSA